MKKYFIAIAAVASLLVQSSPAQDKTKERKTMTFQPGAKMPDEAAANATAAQPVGTPSPGTVNDEPGQAAAAFFSSLQKNLIDEAYANLTKGSKIGERPEELQTLKSKTTEAVQVFGAIQGYELIETRRVGANLMRRTYLSLGRDFPLRWRFYYYRTGGQWRLVDLRVDDRLGGMFEEQDEVKTTDTKTP